MGNVDKIFQNLKIFLSYSTNDKGYVGKIKEVFEEKYGIKAFLAHQDIEVSNHWKQRILIELKEADLYVPILTEHFRNSDWTDQEAGIAVGLGIVIAPLWVTVKPYGFLADHQAGKIKLNKPNEACEVIIRGITFNPGLRKKLIDGFVKVFVKSDGFQTTNDLTNKLEALGDFDNIQITDFVNGSCKNNQIWGATGSIEQLYEFVERHKDLLNEDLWTKFKRKFKE